MSTEKRPSRGNSSRRQKSLLDIWSRVEPSRALRELPVKTSVPLRVSGVRARERSVERSGGDIYFGDSLSTKV